QRLGMTARTPRLDGMGRAVLQQRLGDLRTRRVPRTQEQDALFLTTGKVRRLVGDRCEAKRGVQCGAGRAEQLAAASDVDAIVGVAAVSGAAPRPDQSRRAEFAEVIRDKVLRLAEQLSQLADSPVAASQLDQQLPSLRIGD